MKSAEDGTFNVKGQDAGTYYLKETTTPDGFTPCSVIPPVTITANHNGNHVEQGVKPSGVVVSFR